MYMPGRSRTGSRPSRTVMSLAVYEALAMKKALQLAHFRAAVSLPDPAVVGVCCEAPSRSLFYRFAEFFGGDRRRQVVGGPRLLERRLRRSLPRRRGGLHDGLRKGPRREAQTLRRSLAELAAKTLGDLRLELLQLERPGRRAGVDVQRPVAGEPCGPGVCRNRLAHRGRPGGDEVEHPPHAAEAVELPSHLGPDPLHHAARPSL